MTGGQSATGKKINDDYCFSASVLHCFNYYAILHFLVRNKDTKRSSYYCYFIVIIITRLSTS